VTALFAFTIILVVGFFASFIYAGVWFPDSDEYINEDIECVILSRYVITASRGTLAFYFYTGVLVVFTLCVSSLPHTHGDLQVWEQYSGWRFFINLCLAITFFYAVGMSLMVCWGIGWSLMHPKEAYAAAKDCSACVCPRIKVKLPNIPLNDMAPCLQNECPDLEETAARLEDRAIPTGMHTRCDLCRCCSSVLEDLDSIPREELLCEDSDTVRFHALSQRGLQHNSQAMAAVNQLDYFTKAHPQSFKCHLPNLKDVSFQVSGFHPTPYYYCMLLILFLTVISFFSMNKATGAADEDAARKAPIAHMVVTKLHLKVGALMLMVALACVRPSCKCVTRSSIEQPAKYVSSEDMKLIQHHIEMLLAPESETTEWLVVGDGALLYELMKCLELATMSYFERMLLSIALSSTFMFMQAWCDAVMYIAFPPSEEAHYILYTNFVVDTTILLMYLGAFLFFTWKYKARRDALSVLVQCTAALEHRIRQNGDTDQYQTRRL
jgi:hypothetical protein